MQRSGRALIDVMIVFPVAIYLEALIYRVGSKLTISACEVDFYILYDIDKDLAYRTRQVAAKLEAELDDRVKLIVTEHIFIDKIIL